MADLAKLSSGGPVNETKLVKKTYIAGEAVDSHTPIYIDSTTGKILKASAAAAGTSAVRGITMEETGINQPVECLVMGSISGYDLSGMSYDAPAFLSNTVGVLADAAGTNVARVGRVQAMSDSVRTKILFVNVSVV